MTESFICKVYSYLQSIMFYRLCLQHPFYKFAAGFPVLIAILAASGLRVLNEGTCQPLVDSKTNGLNEEPRSGYLAILLT